MVVIYFYLKIQIQWPVSKILELNSKLVLKEIIHHKSFPNVYKTAISIT